MLQKIQAVLISQVMSALYTAKTRFTSITVAYTITLRQSVTSS